MNHGPANFVCRITVYREGMEGGWEEPLLTGILVVFYGFSTKSDTPSAEGRGGGRQLGWTVSRDESLHPYVTFFNGT